MKSPTTRRAWVRAITVAAVLLLPVAAPLAANATPEGTAGIVAGDPNLLANPGFERPTPDRTGPSAWTPDTETSSSALAWDTTITHSGRHSVRIDSPTPADVWWVQTVSVQPHTLYRLSGWIKTNDVARSPEATDAGANISLLGTFDRSVPLLGTRNWTEVTVSLDSGDLTQLTVAARLGFWGGTTAGTAWFDDLSLTRVSTTDRLRNGGFEHGPRLAGAIPAAWGAIESVAGSTFTWDRHVARAGRDSVRIDSPTPNDSMWAQAVPVRPHTLYQLSGWVRTCGVAHTAQTVDAGANLSFLGTYDRSTPVFGTQGWTYVTATTDSGDQHYLTIAARLGYWSGVTTGTAWFDDLTLTPLS